MTEYEELQKIVDEAMEVCEGDIDLSRAPDVTKILLGHSERVADICANAAKAGREDITAAAAKVSVYLKEMAESVEVQAYQSIGGA